MSIQQRPECTDIGELVARANEPKSVTGDQGSITNHSLRELIEFDKYKRNLEGMRFGQIYRGRYHPPSARGD